MVTVLAYEQLLSEGFVEGRHGSGTYVVPGLSARSEEKGGRTPMRITLAPYGKYAESAKPRVNLPVVPTRPVDYDFSYRSTGLTSFPLAAWQRMLGRRARQAPTQERGYSKPGSVGLREAIATHLRRSRAVNCEPSQIIIVNGSQQGIDLVSRILLRAGDKVVVEDPHYQGAHEIFRASGGELISVRVDDDGLVTRELPRQARLAFVTPSHQFPTGVILPLHRRLELLSWARRSGAIIIEDDYDGEFRYEGQPVESMQGLDTQGRVIYVGTFSRTIFPALRIGYVIVPMSLVRAMTGAKNLSEGHHFTLEQETLAEFIHSGLYERYLRRARRANAKRREALLDAIDKFMGKRVRVTGQGSGAHIVLWPERKISEPVLIARTAAVGVGVYGVAQYYQEKRGRTGLLLGYAHMNEEAIKEGIRRLAKVV